MHFGDVLVAALLLATLGVLVAGVVLMSFGGRANLKYGNRLMSMRVSFQGLALLALALLFLMTG